MTTNSTARIYKSFSHDDFNLARLTDVNLARLKQAQQGDREALNDLVASNFGLVRKIATRFFRLKPTPFLELDDLIQEGCMGLARAIELFDPAKGKFGDYAGYWVSQKIKIYIPRFERFVTLPREVYDLELKKRRLFTIYLKTHGKQPDSLEVLGLTEDEIEVLEAVEMTMLDVSFNLTDYQVTNGHDQVYYEQVRALLQDTMATHLTEKQKAVMSARWLVPVQPTQEAMAKVLGITKQAIGDRERTALKRLKKVLSQKSFRL